MRSCSGCRAWCVIGDQRSDIPFVRAHDRLVAEGVYSMARLRIVGAPEGWRLARHQGGHALSQAV